MSITGLRASNYWTSRFVFIVVVVLAQILFLDRMTSWLAPATLPLAFVIVNGYLSSAERAAITGFVVGLLVDVLPPDTSSMGLTAISFTIVGFLAARLGHLRGMSLAHCALVTGALSFGGLTGIYALAWVIGDASWSVTHIVVMALTATAVSGLATAWLFTWRRRQAPKSRQMQWA